MKASSERIGQWTSASAVALVLLCAVVRPVGISGALAGAAIALVSAFLMARLVLALMTANENARALIAFLLIAKTFVILGGTAAVLFFGHVDVVGFALGVSALVTGVLGGTSHAFLTEAPAAASSDTSSKGAA